MQRILSIEQMQNVDRQAIEELGLPGIVLMENAGRGAALSILETLDAAGADAVLICCGPGNNGGDGYVIARCLANEGVDVRVLSTCPGETLSGDAAVMRGVVEKMGLPLADLHGEFNEEDAEDFLDVDLVVDAMLGTGSTGAPRGNMVGLIEWITESGLPVIAIDIPSGLDANTGELHVPCITARQTITMGAPKRGHLLLPGREAAGELEIVDLGVLPEDFEEGNEWLMAEEHDLAEMLPERPEHGHKGDFGRVLVLAGSPGMAGAALLACRAIMRSGAGMVRLVSHDRVLDQLAGQMPEVMTQGLNTESLEDSLAELIEAARWADLLLIGPGLGRDAFTRELVKRLIVDCGLPVLLDADGINAFEGDLEALKAHAGPLCITPHQGEFTRLLGEEPESEHEAVLAAEKLATELNALVVLKGAGASIHAPEGQVFLHREGSHALATAGSGDVLAGILAGLAVQKRAWTQSALLGLHLHARAGELAASELGAHAVTAPDLLRYLPAAFLEIGQDGQHEHAHEHQHDCEDGHSCSTC